jgi:hypothetical protein
MKEQRAKLGNRHRAGAVVEVVQVSPTLKARLHRQRRKRNALKHGLSTLSPAQSGILPGVAEVARRMCAGSSNPQLYQKALEVAHWGHIRVVAHQHKVALMQRLKDPDAVPRSLWKQLWIARRKTLSAIELADKIVAMHPPEGADLGPELVSLLSQLFVPAPERSDLDAAITALPELHRIGRYERRALSREKTALIEFLKIRELEHEGERKPKSPEL